MEDNQQSLIVSLIRNIIGFADDGRMSFEEAVSLAGLLVDAFDRWDGDNES